MGAVLLGFSKPMARKKMAAAVNTEDLRNEHKSTFHKILEVERVEPVLCLTEDEIAHSQEEGLTNHVLESSLHGPGNLGGVQLQHLRQDWNPRPVDTGDHHGDPGAHEEDGAKNKWMFRIPDIASRNVEMRENKLRFINMFVVFIRVGPEGSDEADDGGDDGG